MCLTRRSLIVTCAAWMFFATPLGAQSTKQPSAATNALRDLNASVEELIKQVSLSVVQVLVTGYGYGPVDDRSREARLLFGRRSIGSGAIIDSNGYIITNAHVVAGAQHVQVVLHGPRTDDRPVQSLAVNSEQTMDARIVGTASDIDLALHLEPEAEIIGRILAADGATLPPLDKIGVSTKPAIVGFAGGGLPVIADAEGKFVLRNLKFPRHQVILTGLPRQYYVKEIRFNGAPSPDWQVTLSPGVAQLEIVIDDKPGTISGTATDGDKPAGQALVILLTPSLQPAQPPALTDPQGNFQFTGIVPGEYRAIAVSRFSTRPEDLDTVTQLAAHTETIRVERGGTSTISLTLAAP